MSSPYHAWNSDITLTERIRPLHVARDRALLETLRQGVLSGNRVTIEGTEGYVVALDWTDVGFDDTLEVKYRLREARTLNAAAIGTFLGKVMPDNIRKVTGLPRLRRDPIELPAQAGDTWAKYEMGEAYCDGKIELETTQYFCGLDIGRRVELQDRDMHWEGVISQVTPVCRYGSAEIVYAISIVPTRMPVPIDQRAIQKDTTVKIFEALVIKINAENEAVEVVKVIPPTIVAKDSKTAREQVLVDYATENKISGKDLSGYSVRVREFQATAC